MMQLTVSVRSTNQSVVDLKQEFTAKISEDVKLLNAEHNSTLHCGEERVFCKEVLYEII
jgi:hypothetical protein